MAYVSLYRKYRSQTFSDLVGQDHVVRTLQSGISSSRIAHSYLFTGPRGTGKTSTARLLAKALCCENGPTPEPDNACPICTAITAGACIDVVEMDAASESGVEDIREQIVAAVEYRPMMCRYKVFIIDEVHDLSSKAFDALLKTVEEPPPHIIFVLATTEYNKVPTTIRSRCQKFEFHRASMQDLVARLEYVLAGEGIKAEPAAIAAIARMADGGYRDALTLLEQAILTSEAGVVTLQQIYDQLGLVSEDAIDRVLLAVARGDVPKLITQLAELAHLGRDPRAILESAMYRLADLTRAAYPGADPDYQTDASRTASLHETAVHIGPEAILRLRSAIADAHKAIRDVSLPRLWLESDLIRLATYTVREKAPIERPPAEKPKPTQATPENKPTQTPQATGNPEFDRAQSAWHEAKVDLGAQSPAMKQRLTQARLAELEGDRLIVQMDRQMDVDWINEKPNRAPAILAAVRTKLGREVEIHYVSKKKANLSEDLEAVELTLEGQALENVIKKKFHS